MDVSILNDIINNSNNIVFFGGAGVSCESGIPDFQSLKNDSNNEYQYSYETMLSHHFFYNNTKEFYRFYKDKMLHPDALPNYAHVFLVALEQQNKLKGIISQNIDGLHQKAGSKQVIELHGSCLRNYCTKCHKFYDEHYVIQTNEEVLCSCGGLIKPDVVLYQEPLNDETINQAIDLISKADVLIVAGTSLNVYPAAGLIDFYQGDKLVLINKDATPLDYKANYVYNGDICTILKQIQI